MAYLCSIEWQGNCACRSGSDVEKTNCGLV